MGFSAFQSETGTLKKITRDGFGDVTISQSFQVKIDPVFGWKRTFDREGKVFTGLSTIITPNTNFDVDYADWVLTYKGKDYQIEELKPFYSIGGNVLTHIEAVMR